MIAEPKEETRPPITLNVVPYESPIKELRRQGFLTPKEARSLFLTRPSLNSIRTWMNIGVHNRCVPNGRGPRIKLRFIREGAMMLTTVQWVEEFKAMCQANQKGGS